MRRPTVVVQVRLLPGPGPGRRVQLRIKEVAGADGEHYLCWTCEPVVVFDHCKQHVDGGEVQGVGSRLDRVPVDGKPDEIRVGRCKQNCQVRSRIALRPLRGQRAVAEADKGCGRLRWRPHLTAQQKRKSGKANESSQRLRSAPAHGCIGWGAAACGAMLRPHDPPPPRDAMGED